MDLRWPWSTLALAGIAVLTAAACGTYRPQDVKPGRRGVGTALLARAHTRARNLRAVPATPRGCMP